MTTATNSRPSTKTVDVEPDVARSGLLEECEETTMDDSELLLRLESAHTMAGGVEAKLDQLLGTLDGLLATLEPKDSERQHPRSNHKHDSTVK